jgi:hypothetical protein
MPKAAQLAKSQASVKKDPHTPTWMEITTYKQGDGFGSYIILHEQTDAMTRYDGKLRVEIYKDEKLLKTTSYIVKKGDFVDTTAGLGAFEHDVTICSLGRTSYDEIGFDLEGTSLEIRAYFETPDGKVLKDKTSQYVN